MHRFLPKRNVPRDRKLGTFLGVFTPTILTILGVIMYLRLGWVIGQVGIAWTLVIVVLANAITLITTLAFSAVATNVRVGVGGAYYIISRSLGLEFGGAIGVPLFLSQAFSVTLYAFGLAESFRILWPGAPVQALAFLIVLGVGALAFRGAALALKAQIPLMILIGVSIAALAFGALQGEPVTSDRLESSAPAGFWMVFAVFFPAVTGIMAGLGLSGDLRDPVKSIPRGALAASLVGFALYLAIPLVLARGATPEALRADPLIWTRIAPVGALFVIPGLWGAIFSSAVGSMLGAPRTLQALAGDGLVPRILGKTWGRRNEPVPGLLMTLAIAVVAVTLGDLETVAPVVTMFFLTVYGVVNLVVALEVLSGDTSWRPRLHVPWYVCLAGGLGCLVVMFLVHSRAAVAAIIIEIALWLILAKRERKSGWGDVRRGVYESLIRSSLIRLARRPMTPRNWRPHVLVFVDNVEHRLDLIHFGTWFSQGRGVVTVCELVVGDILDQRTSVLELEARIQRTLQRERLMAFGEVDVVPDVISGITSVAQANGMAGLDSNTIVLGWPREPERLMEFFQVIRRLEKLNKSVVIGRIQPGMLPEDCERRIHIWWGGLQRNGDLMLLLAHLLTRNPEWRDAKIEVLSLSSNEHMKTNTEAYLAKLIPEIRISAKSNVMILPEGRPIRELIHENSAEADVVFLGLDIPDDVDEMRRMAHRLYELSDSLRTVFFVKNASLFVGKLVEPTAPATSTIPGIRKPEPSLSP